MTAIRFGQMYLIGRSVPEDWPSTVLYVVDSGKDPG